MAKLPKEYIDGVYFYYTSISKPGLKYESKTEYEYKTTIALSKEQAKEFKRRKLNKNVKEVDTADFEEKYKSPPPYPDQDEQYIITLAQNVNKMDGTPLPDFLRPRAYHKVEDGNVDITDQEIANGSFGKIRYSQMEGKNGISIKLDAILLTEFIPYVSTSKDDWADAVVNKPVVKVQAPVQPSVQKPVEVPPTYSTDEIEEDLPF